MRSSARLTLLVLAVGTPGLAQADSALALAEAWSPATARGGDTALYLEVHNPGPADAIVRTRCDAANFTEMRTVDKGEGFPSVRIVKAIPIAAEGVTTLGPEGFSVHLLQATRALAPGEVFDCTIRLQSGGQRKIDVTVKPPIE